MATVLEASTIGEQYSVVRFCEQKNSTKRIFDKEMFPVYREKCLSRKVVHNLVEKFSQRCSKNGDNDEPHVDVAETTPFYVAGFDALVKRWDKCVNVGGGCVEK
jgi:hypothetical protein